MQGQARYRLVGEFELIPLDLVFRGGMSLLRGHVAVIKIDVEGYEHHVSTRSLCSSWCWGAFRQRASRHLSQVFAGSQRFIRTAKPRYILAEVTFVCGIKAQTRMLWLYLTWIPADQSKRFLAACENGAIFIVVEDGESSILLNMLCFFWPLTFN